MKHHIMPPQDYRDILCLILDLVEKCAIPIDPDFTKQCIKKIYQLADLIEQENYYALYMQRIQH